MSIIYTGEVDIEAGPRICVHAFDAEHGNPAVMVRIEVKDANFTLHLSPEDAEAMALRLSQAAAIACKAGEKA